MSVGVPGGAARSGWTALSVLAHMACSGVRTHVRVPSPPFSRPGSMCVSGFGGFS